MFEAFKHRIEQGESDTLEFKSSTSQLKAVLETLCAFLNLKGGEVIIGVNNNGQCVGQMVTDNTRQEIARELSKLEPPVHVEVEYVSIGTNKQIIILRVPTGRQPPYIYDGRPYQREQSTTRRMSQQRYEQLIAERPQLNFSWERLPAIGYTVEDLDENLIYGVIRKAVEVKRLPETALRQDLSHLLETLELSYQGQLNNAAIVLFSQRFNADFIQCQLKVARFKGDSRHEFLDSDLITGNLFNLLEAGLVFIRRHLPLSGKILLHQLERVENLLIPFDAIREALLNTFSHRDYQDRGHSVGIAIYDNRMEIFNQGGLPQEVDLAKIKKGFSKPRNPLIANVLYRCNMIEKWGRGIQEMVVSCKEAGAPEPQFDVDHIEFKVVFSFPHSIGPSQIPSDERRTELLGSLPDRQRKIAIMIEGEEEGLKLAEILKKLDEPIAERTLRDDLAALKRLGIIKTSGRARATLWKSAC